MTMQVLVDADLILEALLNRNRNLAEPAEKLWQIMELRLIEVHITEIGLERICFFVKKLASPEIVEKVISELQEIIQVGPVNSSLLEKALSLKLIEFESAVSVAYVMVMNLGAIVTQNSQKFTGAILPILSVDELLKRQSLEESLEVFKISSVSFHIFCPNCGNHGTRYSSSQRLRTECASCDYVMDFCLRTQKVIEAYAPGSYPKSFRYE